MSELNVTAPEKDPVVAEIVPPDKLVAVVAVVAVFAFPVKLPVNEVAVIIPALKFPLPSLATTLLAVLAEVASTAHVVAADPLKLLPVK